jgi:hypothetical protein
MTVVTYFKQEHVKGGIIVVEALILGFLLGGVLWGKVNPVAGIVAGAGASSFYCYLFTRIRIVAMVMATIASLWWALIAAVITRGLGWTKGIGHDWVWGTVAAALGFYISWVAHRAGAEDLRADRGDRGRWL